MAQTYRWPLSPMLCALRLAESAIECLLSVCVYLCVYFDRAHLVQYRKCAPVALCPTESVARAAASGSCRRHYSTSPRWLLLQRQYVCVWWIAPPRRA